MNIKPDDVNENPVATIYEASAAILEADLAKTTLGYNYRKESIQERYGSCSRENRNAIEKLREGGEEEIL